MVEAVTPEIERAAQGASSAFGRGGMTTKLEAAQAAARGGASTVVCNGLAKDVLLRIAAGERVGTLFLAGSGSRAASTGSPSRCARAASCVIDEGAVRAVVERGKSLLPAGIAEVRGEVRDRRSGGAASTRAAASSRAASSPTRRTRSARIAKLPTREIRPVLGYSNGDEVIHRDDLVLLQDPVS